LNINVSRELVRVVIKRLGLTSKKAKFFATPKRLQETTESFVERRKEFIHQGRYIVSLDETSFGRPNAGTGKNVNKFVNFNGYDNYEEYKYYEDYEDNEDDEDR